VQNAKDTFYEMLRGRLAALNPERTIVVRGITRPSVLVEENEFATAVHPSDCFRLQWSETAIDANGAMPLVTMQCAIDYETAGTTSSGGMDRGRALASMDAELSAALTAVPQTTLKNNYAGLSTGQPAVALKTRIWWGEPQFGKVEVKENRIARTATLAVMSYEEEDEL
jgi:hypothetical protein